MRPVCGWHGREWRTDCVECLLAASLERRDHPSTARLRWIERTQGTNTKEAN